MDTALLLGVQHIANKQGFHIPWDEVGRTVDPKISQGAVVQHLAKLRLRKIADNEPVPPPLRRGGTKNPTASSSRVNSNGGVKKTTSRKGASTAASPIAVDDDDDEEEEEFDVDQASDSEEDFGKSRVKRRKVGNAEAKTKFMFKSKSAVKKEESDVEKQMLKNKGNDRKGKRASTSIAKASPESVNPELAIYRRPSNRNDVKLSNDSDNEENRVAEQYVAKNAPFLKLTESDGESFKTGNKMGKGKALVFANNDTSRSSKMVKLNVGKSEKAARLVARLKGEADMSQKVEGSDTEMVKVSDGEEEVGCELHGIEAYEHGYSGAEVATTEQTGYAHQAYDPNDYYAINHNFFEEAIAASSQGGHTVDGAYATFPTNINYARSQLDLAPSPVFTYDNIPGRLLDTNELDGWVYGTENTGPATNSYTNNGGVGSEMGRPYAQTPITPTSQFQGNHNIAVGIAGPSTSFYAGSIGFDAVTGHPYADTPVTPPNEFQLHGIASLPSTSRFKNHSSAPTTPVERSSAASTYGNTPQSGPDPITPMFESSMATPTFGTTTFADPRATAEEEFEQDYLSAFIDRYAEEDQEGEVEVTNT